MTEIAIFAFLVFLVIFLLFRQRQSQTDLHALNIFQDTLLRGLQETRLQVREALSTHAEDTGRRMDTLTRSTETRLKTIDEQLGRGLGKTTETFADIVKRLALIDSAQQRMTELSGSVLSLHEILTDKRSRGTFGEVQLSALIRNVMPEQNFSFQHTLKNGKRPDCILFLPPPTGHIAVDAKFPLENFRQLIDTARGETDRKLAEQRFRTDIKKHITDIAEKYIVPDETAEGAVMFIPAEAVFAEIHSHHGDLVDLAHRTKVWMVSPTTLMAVLTSARAVLKDAAAREELHLIQKHMNQLAGDFLRFQKRMDSLARHIEQANTDVREVHTSATRITRRFSQIEKVELEEATLPPQ